MLLGSVKLEECRLAVIGSSQQSNLRVHLKILFEGEFHLNKTESVAGGIGKQVVAH